MRGVRHLLDNNTYDCGFCCDIGTTTIGNSNIQVFPVGLSIIMGIMLLFILVKISINYLRLHRERQNQKVLGNSSQIYQTFNYPPPISTIQSSKNDEPLYPSREDEDLHRPLDDFSSEENIQIQPVELKKDEDEEESIPKVYHLSSRDKRGKRDKQYPIRWFHFIYLIVAAGWFLLQSLVLLSSSNSPLIRLIDTFLYEGHGKFKIINLKNISTLFIRKENLFYHSSCFTI